MEGTTMRILSVTLRREVDPDPDTSYLGEYSNTLAPFGIDREAEGDYERGEYRYWNPGPNHVPPGNPASWKHVPTKDLGEALSRVGILKAVKTRKAATRALDLAYVREDYKRHEALNRGDWCYLGISASAEVQLSERGPIQTLRSGGLWGIESDSDKSYFGEVEAEELAALRSELEAVGFAPEQINEAFTDVNREED
jgi:hypothetical protein